MKKTVIYIIFTSLFIYCLVLSGKLLIDRRGELNDSPNGWVLVWEDMFDIYETKYWEKGSHTWKGNLAQFAPENIVFQNGKMRLYLKKESIGEKAYSAAEYFGTIKSYPSGKLVLGMKIPSCKGTISTFSVGRPFDASKNRIDMQFLGKNSQEIFINQWWGEDQSDSELQRFAPDYFDHSKFHEYGLEWELDHIKWSIDGETIHSVKRDVSWLKESIIVAINIWAADPTLGWAKPLDESALPTYVECDYLKFYIKKKS